MASRSLITSESSRRRTQQKEGGRRTVERIAAFASNANPEHLDFEVRHTLKRNVLDSLGCAISALSGPPFRALREQFDEYRSAGTCTLIGGGTTPATRLRSSIPLLSAMSTSSTATCRRAVLSSERQFRSGPSGRRARSRKRRAISIGACGRLRLGAGAAHHGSWPRN
jgi:hypothetical protein